MFATKTQLDRASCSNLKTPKNAPNSEIALKQALLYLKPPGLPKTHHHLETNGSYFAKQIKNLVY
jgi:hypothetical protein